MIFKNSNTYDRFKWFVLIVMPLLVTLLSSFVEIWSIPYGSAIVASVSAVSAFLGGIITKSSNKYNKQTQNSEI